jgi:YgiT-type zinc finger domain-containing protein
MNECHICGGNLVNRLVNICACETLPAIIVRSVPALVCERCEDRQLSQEVINVFDRIRMGDAPISTPVRANLYDYDTVARYLFADTEQASTIYWMTSTATPSVGLENQAQGALLRV